MLLHIPHSVVATFDGVDREQALACTDLYTDELFNGEGKFVFPKSRLEIDVERLADEQICYTHYPVNGVQYRETIDIDYDAAGLEYDAWHKSLAAYIAKYSSMLERFVVVDCHSFSAEQVDISESNLPDICLGYNHPDMNKSSFFVLVDSVHEIFDEYGYTTAFNVPYANAIAPYDADNVMSIMIEVNKRVYLNSDLTKSEGFDTLKSTIDKALAFIQEFELNAS